MDGNFPHVLSDGQRSNVNRNMLYAAGKFDEITFSCLVFPEMRLCYNFRRKKSWVWRRWGHFWMTFILFHLSFKTKQKLSESRVSLSSCLFLMHCAITAQRSQAFNESFCSLHACVEISASSLKRLMELCNNELKLISSWSSHPNGSACLGCPFFHRQVWSSYMQMHFYSNIDVLHVFWVILCHFWEI